MLSFCIMIRRNLPTDSYQALFQLEETNVIAFASLITDSCIYINYRKLLVPPLFFFQGKESEFTKQMGQHSSFFEQLCGTTYWSGVEKRKVSENVPARDRPKDLSSSSSSSLFILHTQYTVPTRGLKRS